MLKYTKDDKTCQHQLEESLNSMLEVVRIVNNSMYEISIVAFQVSVTLCILLTPKLIHWQIVIQNLLIHCN